MRLPVELSKAYRLLNHGPTVLVSAAQGGRRNVMTAAWCMALDFEPPKLAVVLDKATYTRELLLASNHFAIGVPCAGQVDLVQRIGTHSGRNDDKTAWPELQFIEESQAQSPLVAGCIAWLDCVRLPEPPIEDRYDLFLGQITAAWADARVFREGHWHFEDAPDALRSLHHVAGGHYYTIGAPLAAQSLPGAIEPD